MDFLYRSICRFIAAILPIYSSGRGVTTWFVSGVLSNERFHWLTVTPRGTLSRGLLTNERLFVSLFVLYYLRVHSRIFGMDTVRHFESSIWFNHFFISTSGWKRENSFSLQQVVDFFDISEVTALCAFHTKNILFSINCHVAVSGSKFTNDPSKCSQQIGLLPYYHNLLVIFVIFEKNWRLRKKTAKTAFWNVDLGTLAKF